VKKSNNTEGKMQMAYLTQEELVSP